MRLFFSYRRADSEAYTDWLGNVLSDPEVWPEGDTIEIFLDIDHIAPGRNFVEALNESLKSSDALIAIIGPSWVSVLREHESSRLSPDFVRLEIHTALEARIPVFAVLVGGASPLGARDLPSDLAGLCKATTFTLSDQSYKRDAQKLIEHLVKAGIAKTRRVTRGPAQLRFVNPQRNWWASGSEIQVFVDGHDCGKISNDPTGYTFQVAHGHHEVQLRRGLFRSEAVRVELRSDATATFHYGHGALGSLTLVLANERSSGS